MKKLHAIALALVAVFAFSALAVASASAIEWLENSNPIGAAKASTTTGEILLEDTKTFLGAVAMLCSGSLTGTVGAGANDQITGAKNSAGETVGELTLAKFSCANEKNCEKGEAWPDKLPWNTELVAGTPVLDKILGSAYESKCTVLGTPIEDLCEAAETFLPVQNGTTNVITPANSIAEPRANCTQGGTGAGVNETESTAIITLNSGASLQIG